MRANLILGVAGSVTILLMLFELLRRRHLREKYALMWFLVATTTLVVAAVPPMLPALSRVAGVAVPANLLFFVASMVLFVISIQHSHELGRLEEKVRTLAEEVALLGLEVQRGLTGQDLVEATRPFEHPVDLPSDSDWRSTGMLDPADYDKDNADDRGGR